MPSRFNAELERTDLDGVRAHNILRRLVNSEHHASILPAEGVAGGVIANGLVVEEPAADRVIACKKAVSRILLINLYFTSIFIIIH